MLDETVDRRGLYLSKIAIFSWKDDLSYTGNHILLSPERSEQKE